MTACADEARLHLERLSRLAQEVSAAREAQTTALEERASAIVGAIRSGARLSEIGEAAGLSKAAVSVIARRYLSPRPAHAGPYRRRRGTEVALRTVVEAAERSRQASRTAHEAVVARDEAILTAVADGLGARVIAEAVSMRPPVLYQLIRRRSYQAKL